MNPRFHTVPAPEIPLHQIGLYGSHRPALRRMRHTVGVSDTPLYLQGWDLGAGVTTDIATAGSFAAKGATFGPVGAAVGAVVGLTAALIGGLLAGHRLRAQQAKNENSAVNIGVSGFDSDLKQIQQALKSGQIDTNGAMQAVEQTLMPGYWTVVTPQIQPGRNGCNSGSSCPPDTSAQGRQPCVGNIGAACCVGCFQLEPSISGPNGVLAAIQGASGSAGGPHTADIHIVAGSKYGAQTRSAYTLDFTPPPPPAPSLFSPSTAAGAVASAAGIPSEITAALSSPGGRSAWLPLLLVVGVVLALR